MTGSPCRPSPTALRPQHTHLAPGSHLGDIVVGKNKQTKTKKPKKNPPKNPKAVLKPKNPNNNKKNFSMKACPCLLCSCVLRRFPRAQRQPQPLTHRHTSGNHGPLRWTEAAAVPSRPLPRPTGCGPRPQTQRYRGRPRSGPRRAPQACP